MRSLLVTELAKFLHLHAVGVISLVLGRCVVSLFAACTSQSDNYPHDVHLPKTSFFIRRTRIDPWKNAGRIVPEHISVRQAENDPSSLRGEGVVRENISQA